MLFQTLFNNISGFDVSITVRKNSDNTLTVSLVPINIVDSPKLSPVALTGTPEEIEANIIEIIKTVSPDIADLAKITKEYKEQVEASKKATLENKSKASTKPSKTKPINDDNSADDDNYDDEVDNAPETPIKPVKAIPKTKEDIRKEKLVEAHLANAIKALALSPPNYFMAIYYYKEALKIIPSDEVKSLLEKVENDYKYSKETVGKELVPPVKEEVQPDIPEPTISIKEPILIQEPIVSDVATDNNTFNEPFSFENTPEESEYPDLDPNK